MEIATIEHAIADAGLIVVGGFRPRPEDGVPAPATAVVLVGNAGPAMWRAFAAAVPPSERDSRRHPLDDWTRSVLTAAAESLGVRVLFPFDGPPWYPFQAWALRTNTVHPTPIGPLIHPDYGLWHAYRGAFVLAAPIDLPAPDSRPSPCDSCAEQPCLSTCPVDAIAHNAYDVPACTNHIASAAGRDCLDFGCRARLACPVGRTYAYDPAQAAFHMRKFLALHGGSG